MQQKSMIVATVAIVAILAVSVIGIGLAYQATYKDASTGAGTVSGSYLVVDELTSGIPTGVDLIPSSAATYAFSAGIDKDASGNETTYAWNLGNGEAYLNVGTVSGSEVKAYKISAADAGKIKVEALFLVGEYSIKTPKDQNVSVTVTGFSTTGGTNLTTLETKVIAAGEENVNALTMIYHTNDSDKAWDNATSVAASLPVVASGATNILVYALATWTVDTPTADMHSSGTTAQLLTLPTQQPQIAVATVA